MKRNNSPCTIRRALLALLLPAWCFTAAAQGPVSDRYEQLLRRNPWNDGPNVAGLRCDSLSRSRALLSGGAEGGGFRDSWEAQRLWSAGAEAASVMHREHWSMVGNFAYESSEADGMCGSMLLEPGAWPLDVQEFIPGRKSFQRYAFTGGLSLDLSPRWRLGSVLDYSARNAAKRKNLRYASARLDLDFRPGVQHILENGTVLGANLRYARRAETVNAEQIGTAQTPPSAFFDEGAKLGNLEVWTGSGTHLSEPGVSGLPFQENLGGLSLQAQRGRWYADLALNTSQLRVGEKQTIWYRSPTLGLETHIFYRLPASGEVQQTLRLNASWQRQKVLRTVLGKESAHGITLTREYGANRIQTRSLSALAAEYERLGQAWDYRAGLQFGLDDVVAAPLYSWLYRRTVARIRLEGGALRRLGRWSLQAGLMLATGSVSEEEGHYPGAEVTATTARPYRLDRKDYYICNEFASAFRAGVSAGARRELGHGIWAALSGRFLQAFGVQYCEGSARYSGGLSLGYDF